MPISPSEFASTAAYDLLSAVAKGHVAFDRRLISALTADPARTLPDIIRFSREDHDDDRFDLAPEIAYLFSLMPTPEAIPFLREQLRAEPDEAMPELVDLVVILGEPAAAAALELFEETGSRHGELVYLAMMAGARGQSVESAIRAVRQFDPDDAEFLADMAASEYDRSDYEPDAEYPEEATPDLSQLPEAEREEFLTAAAPEFRLMALESYFGSDLTDRRRQQLQSLGASDPDERVRGMAWEVLRDSTDQAPVLAAMKARFAAVEGGWEKACLASALAYHSELPGVNEAIEAAYADPAFRAKALEAMWRSMDRRWAEYPPRHLDGADIEVRRHALLGVGYFQLRSHALRLESFLTDPRLREDALYAYALSAPGEDTAFGRRQLEKRIEDLAQGLDEDEESAVRDALDMRMEMAGHLRKKAAAAPLAAGQKAGRNDPCPCGSGRKYKKCCGA